MSTARALLRGVTSVLVSHPDTDLRSLVRHKRLESAEGPGVHLTLRAVVCIVHPVTDMVKLLKDDGVCVMVKRLLDNSFRHAVNIVFREAVFPSFQAFQRALGAAGAFSLKTALGAKVIVALPVVETSVEELARGRNGNVVDTQVNSHNHTGTLVQYGLSDRNVEKEHPVSIAECRRPHLIVGVVKVLFLIVAQDVIGSHAPVDRGQGAIAILDRDRALVVNDRTEVAEGRLVGFAPIGPFNNTSLKRFSYTVASRAYQVGREISGFSNRVVSSVVEFLFVVALAFASPSCFKHSTTRLIELTERLKQIINPVLRNVEFDRDSLGNISAHVYECIVFT